MIPRNLALMMCLKQKVNTMSNILVTGGAGFVGTNLIESLLEDTDAKIYSIDNYSTGLKENHIDDGRVTYIEGDLSDSSAKHGAWGQARFQIPKDIDVIFHLAALARIQPSYKHPLTTFHANATGTMNICEFARENNIQVIYAASSSVHGDHFANPYTFTKWQGEEVCRMYSAIYDLPTIITRFYNVYGEHMIKGHSPYATVIQIWDEMKAEGKALPIINGGEQRRDFTHVKDICQGLIKCMGKTEYKGEYFELGRGSNLSINEIASMYQSETIDGGTRPGEMKITLADNSKAVDELGFNPVHNLQDYINEKHGL